MNDLKKILVMASAALAVHASLATAAITRIVTSGDPQAPYGSFYGYKDNNTGPGDDAFTKIRAAAVRDHKLMILYFCTDDCSTCGAIAQDFLDHSVVAGAMLKYGDSYNGHFRGMASNPAKAWLDAKAFLQQVTGKTDVGHHVIIAWGIFEDGVQYFVDGGNITTYNAFSAWKMRQCDAFKAQAKKHLYTPPKSDVIFACGTTEGTRLETTKGTENVWIPFVRTNNIAQAETDYLVVKFPNDTTKTNILAWAANQERLELKLADVDTSWVSDGQYTLILCNTNRDAVATNYITCVADKANSLAYPYLVGEKAGYAFGEWTLDYDLVSNIVFEANAYVQPDTNALASVVFETPLDWSTSNRYDTVYTNDLQLFELLGEFADPDHAVHKEIVVTNTTTTKYVSDLVGRENETNAVPVSFSVEAANTVYSVLPNGDVLATNKWSETMFTVAASVEATNIVLYAIADGINHNVGDETAETNTVAHDISAVGTNYYYFAERNYFTTEDMAFAFAASNSVSYVFNDGVNTNLDENAYTLVSTNLEIVVTNFVNVRLADAQHTAGTVTEYRDVVSRQFSVAYTNFYNAVATNDYQYGAADGGRSELGTQSAVLKVYGSPVWDEKTIAFAAIFDSDQFKTLATNRNLALVLAERKDPATGSSLFSHSIAETEKSGTPFVSSKGICLWDAEGKDIYDIPEMEDDGFRIELVRPDGTVAGTFAPQFNMDSTCDLAENIVRLEEFLKLLDQLDENGNNAFETWSEDLNAPTFEYDVPITGKLQISNKANVYRLVGAFGGRDIVFTVTTNAGQSVNAEWNAKTEIWVKDAKGAYTNIPPYFAMHKDGRGIWQVEETYNLSQAEIDAGNVFIKVMAWDDDEFESAKLGGNTEFEFVLSSMDATPCPGIISFGEQPEEPIIQQTTNQVHKVPLHRILGKDGEVGIIVSIVTNLTTATNKYEFGSAESQEVSVHWAAGDDETKYVDLTLIGSELKDGLYDIVLKLSETNAVPNETIYNTYSITYGEEPTSQGQLAFETTTMSLQPDGDGRYYVHYDVDKGDIVEDCEVKVIRTGGLGAAVGYATLKDAGRKVLDSATYSWNNYLTGTLTDWVENFPAPGKIGYTDATITLTSSNNFPVASDKATLNVRVISDAAPSFVERTITQDMIQYVAYTKTVELGDVLPDGMTVIGMSAISGTLPTGLKMSIDKQTGAFTISGTPTKPVELSKSVWWLQLKDASGVIVYSNPVTVTLTVKSLGGTTVDPGAGVIPGFTTARSWSGLPLVDRTAGRLAGILDLTAAKNGRMSARYRKQGNQTISFSSPALSAIEKDEAGVYTAFSQASSTKNGDDYKIEVSYFADDSVAVTVLDPMMPGHEITASTPKGIRAWSKGNPANGWAGDYTLAFRLKDDVEPDARTLCAGAAALRLKMTTSSALSRGAVTFAGTLPNGSAVSGTAYLVPADGDAEATQLPIFMTSSAETLAALVAIDANAVTNTAAIFGVEGVTSYWSHVEGKISELSYENVYDSMGSRYAYADWMKARLVTPNAIQSFNRTSGLAAGTIRQQLDPPSEKLTTCTWKGVILPGWGEAGQSVILGAWWANQRKEYDAGGSVMKTRSVRVGGENKYQEIAD